MPLPYIDIKPVALPVIGLKLHAFGALVATGVMIGSALAVRRAVARGLSRQKFESLVTYCLLFGFVLSHVLDELMYRPKEVLANPITLLYVWKGISSYGSFIGELVGALVWRQKFKEKLLPYADQITAVFAVSWIFGRAGCASAHDHIGRLSSSPLAVAFPGGARFDLGLLEMFLTIPIAIFMWWYARSPRRAGQITGVLCMIYAPIRYPLDALRATDISGADARYVGLTPGQWLSLALFGVGLALYLHARTQPVIAIVPVSERASPEEPASA